ncbi:uncharacterized protein [Primulina huaijiensis]|uniref:uncharacterized protein n=1 Tax=Primulina huaijiensis TaxID=1492673 RepID=UPI003CC74466
MEILGIRTLRPGFLIDSLVFCFSREDSYPLGCSNQNSFIVDGFDNWKKVRNGKAFAFLDHIGKDTVYSPHRNAEKGIPFRCHYEKSSSSNRGNFVEFLDLLTMYNDDISKAIARAPKNAKYTSHDIQKQILHVLSMRVKNAIHEQIGVVKYCIIVDEVGDKSKREQMSIVLRMLYSVLRHYNLDVKIIKGQGYDDTSNMSGSLMDYKI